MALNENVKKVVLTPQEFLGIAPVVVPTTTTNAPYHAVRYRVISEDKTRASHWSPTFKVGLGTWSTTVPKIAFSGINNTINAAILTWTSPSTKFKSFDIFVQWSSDGGSNWTAAAYSGTSNSNTYSLAVPSGYNRIRLIVQVASTSVVQYDPTSSAPYAPIQSTTPVYNSNLVIGTTANTTIT